ERKSPPGAPTPGGPDRTPGPDRPFSRSRDASDRHIVASGRPSAQPIGDSMRRLLCLCIALLGCFPPALAASDFPDPFTLKGHVLDQSRGCIAGAAIEATPQGAGVAASAVSDQAGEFTLVLQPGTYTVTVTAPGFDAASQSVRATTGGSDGRDFVLSVA